MKKRILAFVMAVMMVVVLVIPASATTDTNGTVTVYVTYGMFENGGIGEYPSYGGGLPDSTDINSNFYIDGMELSISDIQNYYMSTTRTVYGVPDTSKSYFKSPNVLDAILTAFWTNEHEEYIVDITNRNALVAGWDDHPTVGNPGGYINGVSPNYAEYADQYPEIVSINGELYDKYVGSGWNIAYGNSASTIAASEVYGTSVALTDGMIIVFDYSPFLIYELHTEN